jgi:hypothetical protein
MISAESFVRVAHHLILTGDIPMDMGLEILSDPKNLYQHGYWRYKPGEKKNSPDFNGIVASLGVLVLHHSLIIRKGIGQ